MRRSRAATVIVGGGIQGLAIAFNLARRGAAGIRVLDAGYFQGGASGRNGTLIRGGFGSPEWTGLFAHSARLWAGLSRMLGENVMFSRRGYLIVAQSAATMARLEALPPLHRENGLSVSLLRPREVAALEPALDTTRIAGALHLRDGGTAPHHAAMLGYLAACRRYGVAVEYGRAVTGFERRGTALAAVLAGEEAIDCERVVIAAGAASPGVGALAGVEIPGFAQRIEAIALEPVRPVLRAAIALPDRLCYLHQTARGEIVGGAEVAERPVATLRTDAAALAAAARAFAEALPCLARLRILRQWAGLLHATPDWGPLLGPHPDLDNLWVSAGWSYGFAGAPAAGDLLAASILADRVDERIAPFAVDRFRRGRPVHEGAIVLAPVE